MKLLIAFAVAALTCVVYARDPTTVCLPDVFQSDVYSLTTQDYGHLAIDFKQEVLGIHYIRSGVRVVFNLTDFSGHLINTTDGSCTQISAGGDIKNVVTKCLPANAILLTNTSKIGVSPNSVDVVGYEIDIGTGVTRVALSNTTPSVPVLREYTSNGAVVDVAFYTNPQTTVTLPQIFTVPAVCPPSTVVG